MDYESCFELVDKPKVFDAEYDEEEQALMCGFRFKEQHTKSRTKIVIARKIRAVVLIIGPGLNCEERRDDIQKESEFCKRAMLIFVPHEYITDFKSEGSSWIEAWNSCTRVCLSGQAFIRFNEDRWQSTLKSQEASSIYYDNIQSELANCLVGEYTVVTMAMMSKNIEKRHRLQ